jgi:hypothetical protein
MSMGKFSLNYANVDVVNMLTEVADYMRVQMSLRPAV